MDISVFVLGRYLRMYGGDESWVGLRPVSFLGRLCRRSVFADRQSDHVLVVHQGRDAAKMAIWHAGNIGLSCLSGLLAAGIQLGMEGTLGIRG
jgi:hypothetical protein